MKIHLTSVFVDDQAKALRFYTDVLGFVKKHDVPVGETDRWLTVTSPEEPDGTELLLEPSHHPAVKPYRDALVADGIPSRRSRWTTYGRSTSACGSRASDSPRSPWRWGPSRPPSSTTHAGT